MKKCCFTQFDAEVDEKNVIYYVVLANFHFFCEIKTVKFLQGALVPASTGPPNGSGPQQGQIRSSIDMVRVYNYGPQSLQQQPPQTNPIMVLKKTFFSKTTSLYIKKRVSSLGK